MVLKTDKETREEKWAREEREREERERSCPFVDLQQCSSNCRFFLRFGKPYCQLLYTAESLDRIARSLSSIVELLSEKFAQEGSS